MTVKNILLFSRPRFWFYILGPYIIGISGVNNPQALLHPIIVYGLFYFLLPANIFIYGINDYFDRSLDLKNPKKHTQETYMKAKDAKIYMFIVVLSIALSFPLFFFNSFVALAMGMFIFLGFFYSSPPLRFKTKVFFDSFSNFFYILPGVIGYALVTNSLPPFNILIAASLWASAMHLFSAIVDISADAKAGIKTTATALGYTYSLILVSLLWFVAVVLVISYSPILILGFIYTLLPLLILLNRLNISKAYWAFPWINMIMGFILFCITVFTQKS